MKQLIIELTDSNHKQLKIKAATVGVAMKSIVTKLINDYLKNERKSYQ